MSPFRQGPDRFGKTSKSLNIPEIFNNPDTDPTLTPPKPNSMAEVPYNRLVHHIDYLEKLNECVAVDRGVVDLIHRRLSPFTETNNARQMVTLNLMEGAEVVPVKIWVIPVFSEGVMVYHLFASDDENLEHLRRLRNPAKPGSYDITSL